MRGCFMPYAQLALFYFLLSASAHAAETVPPLLDLKAMNTKANPCENFYEYACGTWQKNAQILPHKAAIWRQGEAVTNNLLETQNAMLAGKFPNIKFPYQDKVVALYQSCMNETGRENQAKLAIDQYRALINSISDEKSLASAVAKLHHINVNVFFEFYAAEDFQDALQIILHVDGGGISLPEKNYYFNDDILSAKTRDLFEKHIQELLMLVGEKSKEAKDDSKDILSLETKIAAGTLSLAEQTDAEVFFHPMKMQDFKKTYPNFAWDEYFAKFGIKSKKLNVRMPKQLEVVNAIFKSTSLEILKKYMLYWFVDNYSHPLGADFEKESFAFWEGFMNGKKAIRKKWMLCSDFASDNMREAIGQGYVAMIPEAATIKSKAKEMFGSLLVAFAENLKTLSWIDSKTQKQALTKLHAMVQKIAYPEKWINYDKLQVNADSYLQNSINLNKFFVDKEIAKLDKKADREEWNTKVWEDNAYYQWSTNTIIYPLGNLVPPLMDLTFSRAANYGSGSIMGHELTHGFDNSGSKFDSFGTLKNWWSKKTFLEFDKRAECLVRHASQYKMSSSDLKIDGRQVLTENIADHGGIKLAYLAYKSSKGATVDWNGLSDDQQFFLAYAQGWCTKPRPENMRTQILSDEHAPEEYRVNGVLSNTPEFSKAFSCKVGQPLDPAPEARCSLW